MLKISNTNSKEKKAFSFHKKGEVSLYVCGMTVYDQCHLGHARSSIIFDVIRNYLEYKGMSVRYVKNYTDIDDKIIDRAKQEGRDWKEIADRFIASYERDMDRLGVRAPTLTPKATEHIPDMIALIDRLHSLGMAYDVEGNVFFKVTSFPSYGKLSGQKIDEMIAGVRVEVDLRKKNPLDFVLWKASKAGEPSWESPWGPGRPGWHIECSAMAIKHLGETIDLHGGGKDLIFPHHENEIAQSEAATGKEFASCWIHHGFVTIDREKMSKSLGNFFTVDEIFRKSAQFPEKVIAEVLRFYLLSTQYRSPIDFSDQSLKVAKRGLDHFYTLFQKMAELSSSQTDSLESGELERFQSEFEAAMDDDFNTAKALAVLQTLRSDMNNLLIKGELRGTMSGYRLLQRLGKCLGLFQIPTQDWRYQAWNLSIEDLETKSETSNSAKLHPSIASSGITKDLSDVSIQSLIEQRESAREKKDWETSDKIRDRLAKAGVILEDRPDGSTRIKR